MYTLYTYTRYFYLAETFRFWSHL